MEQNYDALGYYEVLHVTPNATIDEIKQNYYEQAKYWHPDHNENANALEIFQKISVAYNVLKDGKSRLKYDLLTLIYNSKKFPDMNSLNIYKNQEKKEDAGLRVLKQKIITSDLKNCKVEKRFDICNFNEAQEMVLNTALHNWLKGWWSVSGIRQTIEVIKYNLNSCNEINADNFKLFIHNAVAYFDENNTQMAWIYANRALRLADPDGHATNLLNRFIQQLNYAGSQNLLNSDWSEKSLKIRQMLIPLVIGLMISVAGLYVGVKSGFIRNDAVDKSNYYSEVHFRDGSTMADDRIETQVVKYAFDLEQNEYLYHAKSIAKIFYGPDEKYDVLRELKNNETVRLLGYTPNKKWYQIMLDDGETGFVLIKNLEKGMGEKLSSRSKIYKQGK